MRPEPQDPPPETQSQSDPEYGDFLLVDILRPDFKHFFSRYRIDLIGLVIITAVVVFIVVATKWLAMIGSADVVGR